MRCERRVDGSARLLAKLNNMKSTLCVCVCVCVCVLCFSSHYKLFVGALKCES